MANLKEGIHLNHFLKGITVHFILVKQTQSCTCKNTCSITETAAVVLKNNANYWPLKHLLPEIADSSPEPRRAVLLGIPINKTKTILSTSLHVHLTFEHHRINNIADFKSEQ